MIFCHKCGAKADDDAIICSNCGEKLILDDTEQQVAATVQSQMNNIQPNVYQQQKKKSHKLPIILGIAAFVVVAFIAAIGLSGDKINYAATVKAHKPFAVSQNLPYTYNEVFEKYIVSPLWEVRESDKDTAYVDIKGTAKGIKNDLVITIKVAPNPDNPNGALIKPDSVTINGDKSPTENDAIEFILAMFSAYDQKYDDLSDFPSAKSTGSNNYSDTLKSSDSQVPEKVVLSEIYSSESDGIKFNYPSDWIVSERKTEYDVVKIVDSKNNANSFSIYDPAASTPFGDISEDEESIKKAINEYDDKEFIKFEEVLISGVSAKCVTCKSSSLKGTNINKYYWYNSPYAIMCSYTASEANKYEPIFDAIMDSYIISEPTPYTFETDNNSTVTERDSSLYGRWRSYDGSIIELSNNGFVTNVNFTIWKDSTSNPNSITWKSSNGQLTFDSQFNMNYEWNVEKVTRLKKEVDRLTLKQGRYRVDYYRMENTPGEGLIGQWELERTATGGNLILNSDGTGMQGSNTCTWTSDDKNFWQYVHQISSYDYSVSGDTLQLFFSNGSKIFTKIGN